MPHPCRGLSSRVFVMGILAFREVALEGPPRIRQGATHPTLAHSPTSRPVYNLTGGEGGCIGVGTCVLEMSVCSFLCVGVGVWEARYKWRW